MSGRLKHRSRSSSAEVGRHDDAALDAQAPLVKLEGVHNMVKFEDFPSSSGCSSLGSSPSSNEGETPNPMDIELSKSQTSQNVEFARGILLTNIMKLNPEQIKQIMEMESGDFVGRRTELNESSLHQKRTSASDGRLTRQNVFGPNAF